MSRTIRTPLWLAAILLAPLVARAADGSWAVDANGNWSDPANWSGGIVADGPDFTANFTNELTSTRTINLDTDRTIGNLSFSDNGASNSSWLVSSSGPTLSLATSTGTPTIQTATPATIAAAIAGTNGLTKTGSATLTLSGTNTYTGGTTISSGTLSVTSDESLGDASGGITIHGGRLRSTTNFSTMRPISLATLGSFNTNSGLVTNLGGVISGLTPSAGVSVTGTGTTVLSGANTYQGTTLINNSSVLRAVDGVGLPAASNLNLDIYSTFQSNGIFTRSLGTGPSQFQWNHYSGFSAVGAPLIMRIGGNTDTLLFASGYVTGLPVFNDSISADSLVDLQNGIQLRPGGNTFNIRDNPSSNSDVVQFSGPISGGPSNALNLNAYVGYAGTLILTGANSYGSTLVFQGTLQIGNGGTTGTLGTGSVAINPSTTLIFNRSNAMTVDTYAINGGGAIRQIGPGATTIVSSMVAYAGAISVSAGTLLINTTVGYTTPVTVDGGTLGGTGSLGTRPITINGGGTLAPGASVGMFATGSVSFTAVGSRFNPEIDLGPTLDADLLNVTGSIALSNSTLDVALWNLPTSQAFPLTFLLVNNDDIDPVTGEFGIIQNPIGFGVTVNYAFTGADALGRLGDGNDIAVTITPVPEPAAFVLALTAAAMLLGKRRRT